MFSSGFGISPLSPTFTHSYSQFYFVTSSSPCNNTICTIPCWHVGVMLRLWWNPHTTVKDDSKYYFCACVSALEGLSFCFSTCAIFSEKGEIKLTDLVSFLPDIEKSRCIFNARATLLIPQCWYIVLVGQHNNDPKIILKRLQWLTLYWILESTENKSKFQ